MQRGGRKRPRPLISWHLADVDADAEHVRSVTYLTLEALLASLQNSMRLKIYFLGVALLFTIMVGISRVYLGVHYPTEVMAGWCIGAAWAAACWTSFPNLRSRARIPRQTPRGTCEASSEDRVAERFS